ncbi:LytR/AlgR family response regulator transcription factor [Clostridium brassicae]|uniref:Stage 0 sporulation protein A homolog n=1 Tax=Clostridium brassicae TaxID=2999072 RepID=A0ABT4DDR5_9CLOT|nr:LytTR family DNA-binding domain-containing protein [Clostridium brassicae]MCY6960459.1 LytTR family DNA-binding domain-containing protein [Clostridium brassicae]
MYNILLVEDDRIQRVNLKKIICKAYDNLNFYEAEDKDEALYICQNHNIDIFFIDISLKNSSGIDLAIEVRKIREYELSWIVFLTTHVQYLVQAFKEIHCYDYILKPYDKETVISMVRKLIKHSNTDVHIKKERQYVIIELRSGVNIKLYIDEIIFIESKLRKNFIYTTKEVYESSKLSIKKLLEIIDSEDIIKSHKSFAVNINYIEKIEKIDSRLSEIYFQDYDKKALLGYKYRSTIVKKFKISYK